MKKLILATLLLYAVPVEAEEQRGIRYGYNDLRWRPVTCGPVNNGGGGVVRLPSYAPSPTPLTWFSISFHIGTSPREPLAGLWGADVVRKDRTRTPIATGMSREGAKYVDLNPPILINPGDSIVVWFGCGGTTEQVEWDSIRQQWVSRSITATIAPDIGLRWRE